MKTFEQYLVEFDFPQIYCDMDGVIADFVTFTKEHLGHPFNDDYWQDLPEDLFYQLPLMPDANKLWNYIKQFDPFMLTAIPRDTRGPISGRAAEDKSRWMKKKFGLNKEMMRPVMRRNKSNFAKDGKDGRPNLLIDDHKKNVEEFKSAGGIGIHHINAASTIRKLKKLGYP
jgi:5'(3')-deoxyribonucleotidase